MHYLERATDDAGYPAMDFEAFYQQGVSCFVWGLPRPLVRQAFKRVCADRIARGKTVALWQVRAFVYGLAGRLEKGKHVRRAPDGYQWPTPPDASWELVVCVYPDGVFELDLLHSVSCRFWSETNGFFAAPTDNRHLLNRSWFVSMGFDVLTMHPALQVKIAGPAYAHLKLV